MAWRDEARIEAGKDIGRDREVEAELLVRSVGIGWEIWWFGVEALNGK
jgi:hypothetical protein